MPPAYFHRHEPSKDRWFDAVDAAERLDARPLSVGSSPLLAHLRDAGRSAVAKDLADRLRDHTHLAPSEPDRATDFCLKLAAAVHAQCRAGYPLEPRKAGWLSDSRLAVQNHGRVGYWVALHLGAGLCRWQARHDRSEDCMLGLAALLDIARVPCPSGRGPGAWGGLMLVSAACALFDRKSHEKAHAVVEAGDGMNTRGSALDSLRAQLRSRVVGEERRTVRRFVEWADGAPLPWEER